LKLLAYSILVLCVAAGTGKADATFTITQNPDVFLTGGSPATEQVWNFTTLPGWNASYPVDSVAITETFSAILPTIMGVKVTPAAFQSTIINFADPLATAPEIYFLFNALKFPLVPTTATETATIDAPFPCCSDQNSALFTTSDITGAGVLGQFDTRVARNSGSFELDSISISIMVQTPEPGSFVLMGLGLAVFALIARRLI
jgi:PEP-CTERM motif